MSEIPTSSPPPDWLISLIQGTAAVPKSVAKLLDTVGEQIGLFFEPIHIRRKGKAEDDVAIGKEKTKGQIALVRLDNKLALKDRVDRAEERVSRREEKRQGNLEAITAQAAQALTDQSSQQTAEPVSDQPVDDDWVAEFLNQCQDISDEQMQSLWARLLAGEVTKPGSFSLRTLAVVRTLSKDDADLFTRFCSIVWQVVSTNPGLRPLALGLEKLQSIPGIRLQFEDFVRLDSIGLVKFEIAGGFNLTYKNVFIFHESDNPVPVPIPLRYYDRLHIISKKILLQRDQPLILQTGQALLTNIGQELAPISGSAPNEEYRQLIVSELRRIGWEVAEQELP